MRSKRKEWKWFKAVIIPWVFNVVNLCWWVKGSRIFMMYSTIQFATNWTQGASLFFEVQVNAGNSFYIPWISFVCILWWLEFLLECISLVTGAWFDCFSIDSPLSSFVYILDYYSSDCPFLTVPSILSVYFLLTTIATITTTTTTNDMSTSTTHLQLISGNFKIIHISHDSKSNFPQIPHITTSHPTTAKPTKRPELIRLHCHNTNAR